MAAQLNLASPVQVLAPERRRAKPTSLEHIIPGFALPGAEAGAGAWAAAFEDAYATAQGDLAQVPWCRGCPDPALISWIDTQAPGIVRPGATVAVVGCGTGDDAAELASRGYDISAIDVSPTAISWAQHRFGHMADCFHCADLLSLPPAFRRRSDLVIAVEVLSWLPPALRQGAAESLAAMARPRGMVVVVCAMDRSDEDPGSAPFPLEPAEVGALMAAQGMSPLTPIDESVVESCDGRRLCAAFRRS